MNLFQIDFIQGKTDAANYATIVHSLHDSASERQIISLSLSADKLQSVSCFMREPKRLEFECFTNAWISEFILSGAYEHDRYISHYEVKAYRDSVLIFSGIIDTSSLTYSPSDQVIKFLCYDKIKLFSIFSDMQQFYSLYAGYQPAQILGYFAQKISQAIPISVPYSSSLFAIPDNLLPAPSYIDEAVQLGSFDIADMCSLPANAGGWTYAWDSSSYITPKYGYYVYSGANKLMFIIGHKKIIKATYPDPATTKYKSRYYGVYMMLCSGCSKIFYEYSSNSDWVEELSDLSSEEEKFQAFFTDKGTPQNILTSLNQIETMNGTHYYCNYALGLSLTPYIWNQWLPTHVHPGKFYETAQTELSSCLRTLQAVLLLYNATLIASPSGVIGLVSKEPTAATPIQIQQQDVLSFSLSRINPEVPDTSVMDAFAGDSSVLQSLAKAYLMSFHALRWQLTATLDNPNKYTISIGDIITIEGANYYVTECLTDWIADDYKIKGWML